MKVAILFSGAPRSLNLTHQNIRKTLDSAFGEYDVYAYIPECDTSHQVAEYFPDATAVIAPDVHIDTSAFGNVRFKTGIQAYLQQLNGLKNCYHMCVSSGRQYDFLVRCRMDVMFTSGVPSADVLDQGIMYIPDFHHHGGVNDRFCIAHPDIMANYCCSLDIALQEPEKCDHAETFLSYSLQRQLTKVQFIPVTFDRVRQNGQRIDDTHCRKGGARKYPSNLTVEITV